MDINAHSFQTRARTIDHLGREQIADCPTAISELWKNAYDAYAKNVCLNIFDGEIEVAALVDDGHGMDKGDLKTKWLTLGTESKATGKAVTSENMNNLERRPIQGQKGIGRLSCAALGSLLLLISKKKNSNFSACLLDWRLFENPYLMLHDIKIPVIEFEKPAELAITLPEMFDTLMGNLWGKGNDVERNKRIESAWNLFDLLESSENENSTKETTKEKIEKTIINESFNSRHLDSWGVWNGKSSHGTAMLMACIHEDLKAQLSQDSGSESDGAELRAKEVFKQTLSNFTNPFIRKNEVKINNFNTSVIAWNGALQRSIVDEVSEFEISSLDTLEHIIEGDIDEHGKFTGKIKAFGKWYENEIINPKSNYRLRKDTRFGPFSIRIGSFEYEAKKSINSDELRHMFITQVESSGGVMVHRDGLRVMPYGREDNDFFEIEKRRTKNAGRYFFSNRRSFGGISISKEHNPNLRDKAGREGIIDNKASKLLREIVENILIETADRYLGRKSDNRKNELEEISKEHSILKATEDRRKLLRKEQKRIRTSIKNNEPLLIINHQDLLDLSNALSLPGSLKTVDEITGIKEQITNYDRTLKELSLSPIPKSLGSIEESYRNYRDIELSAKKIIKQLEQTAINALDTIVIKSDIEVAEKVVQSKAATLHARIRKWANSGRKKLRDEEIRFDKLIEDRNKSFHNATSEHITRLIENKMSLSDVISTLDYEYQKQDIENEQVLAPYIAALESMSHQIDLEGLALHSVNESTALKQEVERLNGLAQLGITVEIIGHEIEGLDQTIERGVNNLEKATLTTFEQDSLKSVKAAHQSLSDRLRFLSPLKLSGEKVKENITGQDIFDYINNFYDKKLKSKNITLVATKSFTKTSIYEQPSRLYPVFINLINNSRYWVCQNDTSPKTIKLDFHNDEIYICDNGPGVDPDDIANLFTIFFTRKQRGGRGVGLYLCRTNLLAGGHSIRYETDASKKILEGANFAINLKGIKHA